MTWLAFIQLVIKAVASLADYLGNKQLLDAGKAQAISAGLQQTLDNIGKANAVEKELRDNPNGDFANSVRDKYTRDE